MPNGWIVCLAVMATFLALSRPVMAGQDGVAAAWPVTWGSKVNRDHPLAGRIWDARKGGFTSPEAYGEALARARYVLLGEIHDNGDHHLLQGWAVSRLASERPAVVFEQFAEDQDQVLAAFAASRPADEPVETARERLMLATLWGKSGWPPAETYAPLFNAVLGARLPMVAGNVPKARVRSVAMGGLDGIAEAARRDLQLHVPLEEKLRDDLLNELEASHCQLLPKSAFGGMADAQRLRDGFMARRLADAATEHGRAVLIAGNGHVQSDRGVPWYLRRMAPDAAIVAVQHAEVAAGKSEPRDYVGAAGPLYDFIVFTPRHEREDPCIKMRERFGKKR